MTAPLEVVVQGTPNPNASKFTLNRVVAAQGRSYRDAASADADWVKAVFALPGITQVFVLNNFISVNKAPDADWSVIGPQVERILRQAFT